MIFFSFVVFMVFLTKALKTFPAEYGLQIRDLFACTCLLAVWLIPLVQEPSGYKVIYDEIILTGSAQQMHFEREMHTPLRGYTINGVFYILGSFLDKRPFFFPFLVSLMHDFSGYRPENVFYLNFILSFVLVALVYLLGRIFSGVAGGLLAGLLLASLPLLAQLARSGGFELLNLLMIVLTILLGIHYYRKADSVSLTAFGYSGLLLALVRHESIIFVIPVGLTTLWRWWKSRKLVLPGFFILIPLLLTIYTLQLTVFEQRSERWQLKDKPDATSLFGLQYLPDNFGHALNFFFDPGYAHPNSLFLSVFGLFFGILFLVKLSRKTNRELLCRADRAPLLLFGVTLFLVSFVLLGYFYGQFDDHMMSRLSLPSHLLLIFPGVIYLGRYEKSGQAWWCALVLAVIGFFAQSLPTVANGISSRSYVPATVENWKRAFIKKHRNENFLFIDYSPILPITYKKSGLSYQRLAMRRDELEFHFAARSFDAVYLFQNLARDEFGTLMPYSGFETPEGFALESVAEKHFSPLAIGRISRIVAITSQSDPYKDFWANVSQIEDVKGRMERFHNEWLKRLP